MNPLATIAAQAESDAAAYAAEAERLLARGANVLAVPYRKAAKRFAAHAATLRTQIALSPPAPATSSVGALLAHSGGSAADRAGGSFQ